MSSLLFSLPDYKSSLGAGFCIPPASLCPYYELDPKLFRKYGSMKRRGNDLRKAIDELQKRMQRKYFNKIYPLQARTLLYSSNAFPTYRFILPEVMTEDWLATVDWGKFQRDHVLHQPLCGYVMLKLLCGTHKDDPFNLPNGKTLLDEIVDNILKWDGTAYIKDFLLACGMKKSSPILNKKNPISHAVWKNFFKEAAYVASVFHDLGYPWQYAERIQTNLDGMNAPALRQNRSAEQIYESFKNRIIFNVLNGYRSPDPACPSTWQEKLIELTEEALALTHGLPGALGFLHLNDYVRRYPSNCETPLRMLCVEWAATAIMMHDMVKIYWGETDADKPKYPHLRLSFDKDPLSAMVTFVDVLQEFERPNARFSLTRKPIDEVKLSYNPSCISTELELNGSVMRIKYKMADGKARAIKRISLRKENKAYFDVQYGFLDMSCLGIGTVQMSAV